MSGQSVAVKAQSLLTAFHSQLTTLGISVPERQYIAPGSMIPWDGEQLVVNLQTLDMGLPGAPVASPPIYQNAATFAVTFTITLIRSVPSLDQQNPLVAMIPSAEETTVAGDQTMADADGLIKAAMAAWAAGQLTNGGQAPIIGPMMSVGPEGGLAGLRLQITVPLS